MKIQTLLFVLLIGACEPPSSTLSAQVSAYEINTNRKEHQHLSLPESPAHHANSFLTPQALSQAVVTITAQKYVHNSFTQDNRTGVLGIIDEFFSHKPISTTKVTQQIGSGFIVHHQGIIITSSHVVKDADIIRVHFHPQLNIPSTIATLVANAPSADTAFLKVEDIGSKQLPILYLGNSDAIHLGQKILIIGSPFGLSHTLTYGSIANPKRSSTAITNKVNSPPMIQIDGSVNPGNSGGPIINEFGDVVGIAAAYHVAANGIGFAIPINEIRPLLDQYLKNGFLQRWWLGVHVQPLTQQLASFLQLPNEKGALVIQVIPHSPAAKSNIKEYDVIQFANGRRIQTPRDLWLLLQDLNGQQELTFNIMRASQKIKTTVHPILKRTSTQPHTFKPHNIDELLQYWGLTLSNPQTCSTDATPCGCTISSLLMYSPADLVGLHTRDQIVSFNNTPVQSVKDIQTSIAHLPAGKQVVIKVIRSKRPFIYTLQIPKDYP